MESSRFQLAHSMEWVDFAEKLTLILQGSRLNQIYVPEAPWVELGFQHREWVLDFSNGIKLFLSLRAGQCGLVVIPEIASHSFKKFKNATGSTFDLVIKTQVCGGRFQQIRHFENDRALEIEFSTASGLRRLHFSFLPTKPVGLVLEPDHQILACTLTPPPIFPLPPAKKNLVWEEKVKSLPRRDYLLYSSDFVEHRARAGALARLEKHAQSLRAQEAKLRDQWLAGIRTLEETQNQPDYGNWAKLIQANLYRIKNESPKRTVVVQDHERGQDVSIPGHEQATTMDGLMQFYFSKERRRNAKIADRKERNAGLARSVDRVKEAQEKVSTLFALKTLPEIQDAMNALGFGKDPSDSTAKTKPTRQVQFSGRTFLNRENFTLRVGRDNAENLELVQKISRGNDVWMHIKGRPGAHVVIQVPPKKTASLETLLDGANLCLHYSGGKFGAKVAGKTEVDYCFRKYVKRIPKSTEVTYSQNKTLVVTYDEKRMARLSAVE